MRALRTAWRQFADLVLPTACAGCGRPEAALCARCGSALLGPPRRVEEGTRYLGGRFPVWALTGFAGPARELIVAYKDRGRRDLAEALGLALAVVVHALVQEAVSADGGAGRFVLVPIPSSRASVRRRGEDTLRRCARRAAAELRAAGAEVFVADLLRQRRRVRDQAGLTAEARRRNLAGSLSLRRRGAGPVSAGARFVLVDDVVTTGATLAEGARALGPILDRPPAAAVIAATGRTG